MARVFYTLIYALLLPVFVARLWWRGRLNPGYRQRIHERFALFRQRPPANGLWLHAVSVGETLAAAPLVSQFRARYPACPVIVTTTTPTGSEQVQRLFGDDVLHVYLPYDLPVFWQLFLKRMRPGLLVVMETELWPNLLAACERESIPVMLANARLSEKSARGYRKFSALTFPMLQRLSLVAVQNAVDGQRFLGLGLAQERLEVTGSVKFDVSVPDDIEQQGQLLRAQWGSERPVLALASSHAGEDELLLSLYPALAQQIPGLLLLLIPRHPERFAAVAEAARAGGLPTALRSENRVAADTQVYVADSMGEMLRLLASADLVLVGGSLIPHGGHNPIEPAALGKATLMGPHHMNFAAIAESLQERGALALVSADPADLQQQLLHYLERADERQAMGGAGRRAVAENRGAVNRLTQLCAGFLKL
ncbi:lipid IV(A) 3-deoxy-D-manno-octulosonic acid transferase [Thalassolituus sp. LLYu03]|uniref:lipid IV(A) 3-deoxy-D-manno-octulosonic acid transferase n=1 Tax=Thalassolituus sp. LLYu03 TaxID=3421656 RepID=UPI003D2E34AD